MCMSLQRSFSILCSIRCLAFVAKKEWSEIPRRYEGGFSHAQSMVHFENEELKLLARDGRYALR